MLSLFKKKFDKNFSSSLRGRRTVRFQCRQAESFPRAAWRGPCRRVSSRRGASSGAWQRPPTPPWLPTCRTLPSPHTPSCPSQTPPTPSSSLPPPPSTSPRCSVATSASPAGGGRRGRCFLTPSWRGWREGRQELWQNVLVWGKYQPESDIQIYIFHSGEEFIITKHYMYGNINFFLPFWQE